MDHLIKKRILIKQLATLSILYIVLIGLIGTAAAGAPDVAGIKVQTSPTSLTISSIPAGATLFIDAVNVGKTPFTTATLITGNHNVILRMAGYMDYTDTVATSVRAPVTKLYTLVPVTTRTVSPGKTIPIVAGGRILPVTTTPVPFLPGRLVPAVTTTPVPWRPGFSMPVVTTTTMAGNFGSLIDHPNVHVQNLTIPSLKVFVGTQKQTVGQLSRTVYYPSTRPASSLTLDLPSKTLIEVSKEYQKAVYTNYSCPNPQNTQDNGGAMHTVNEGTGPGSNYCEPVYQDIWSDRADPYNISASLENYRFRWASDAPNVTQGRWQVSIYPFPDREKNWDNPPGLVAYGTVSGKPASGGTVFTIPFAYFMNLSYGSPPVNADLGQHPHYSISSSPGNLVQMNSYPMAAGKEITGVKFLNTTGVGFVISAVQIGSYTVRIPSGIMALPSSDDIPDMQGVSYGDTLVRRVLVPGAPSTKMAEHERVYYVRIVALNADGKPADKPSPDVEVHIKGAQLYMLPRHVKTMISVSSAQCYHEEFFVSCDASDVDNLNAGTSENSKPYSQVSKSWGNGGIVQDSDLQGLIFNWSTNEPGIQAGKWQLLRTDYPMDGYDWEHPHGYIAEGVVSANKYFQIDLAKYHLPPSSIPDPGSSYYPSGAYYIRLLPLGTDNKVIGPPSAPVILYTQQTQPLQTFTCDPTKVIKDRHPPSVSLVSYTPIQSERPDAATHFIWTKACTPDEYSHCSNPFSTGYTCSNPTCMFGSHNVGDTIHFSNDHSWFDDFVNFIGDLVSFIGDIVNWVSDAWNSIKAAAINIVASTIPFCSDSDICKDSLGGALDYGLMALGVPPTLPTFSDLEDMGTNYLVELGTSEIGADGVISPDDVRGAAGSLIAAHKSMIQSGPQTGSWPGLVPDPAFLHKPAYIDVIVSNPNSEPTDPSVLIFYDHLDKNLYPDPTLGNAQYAADHIPQSPDDHLFRPKEMPIPSLQPGRSYHIPIVLEEDFGYWANNTGYGGTGPAFPDQVFYYNYDESAFTIHIDTPDMRDPDTGSFIYFGSPPPASACTKEIHAPPDGWIRNTVEPFPVSPPSHCYSQESCTNPYETY